MAVDSGDLTYVLRREAYWRWTYEPTDLIVGDTFQVKVASNSMFIKRPNGRELKMAISRRKRHQDGKPSASCALPVAVR